MVFASPVFLFFFLSVALIGSYVLRGVPRNLWIFVVSVAFYSWGGLSYTILLLISTVVNYVFGFLVDQNIIGNRMARKTFCALSIIYNLGILAFFKYFNFAIENILNICDLLKRPVVLDVPHVALPIGISFFTFQIMSYVIDVYRGEVPAQKNPINVGMYIFLFPQLIAGPIVRYVDVQKEIDHPKLSAENFRAGFIRFVVGLGKKVLISNAMGSIADTAFNAPELLDMPTAWLGIIGYTLHIYFDFSAYSDMAIGMGQCMGFHFLENFNYPYISKSIKEFWRRWHISLSTWFRDYLYIPLGGNRGGKGKTYRNLLIVFFVTGLWHGASWTFVVWGLYHGAFLLLERRGFGKILEGTSTLLQRVYTLFVVMIGWVFFRADTISDAFFYIGQLFCFDFSNWNRMLITGGFSRWFFLLVAVVFSAPVFPKMKHALEELLNTKGEVATFTSIIQDILVIALLLLCLCYLAGGGYNPFIYFKF